MANLFPIESLTQPAKPASGFELAVPNPILAKTVFVRLPVPPSGGDWTYQINAADLRSERNLILGDQMWVVRGAARFVIARKGGASLELRIRIRPWKPKAQASSLPDGRAMRTSIGPPDERRLSRSLLGRLGMRRFPGQLTINCCRTERRIEIRWQGGATTDFERWLESVQCH